MENLIWLGGGFLLGWILEWMIDFFYWRRPNDQEQLAQFTLDAAQARTRALENEKLQLQTLVEDHAAILAERDALAARLAAGATESEQAEAAAPDSDSAGALAAAQAEIRRLARELAAKQDAVAVALGGRAGFAADAAETLIAPPLQPDDLTRVKGIGPKIQGLLHESGVLTFSQLALASVGQLEGILDQAGERFNLAEPQTWPAQAILAAQDDWPTLDALQKQIQVGRRQSDDAA